MRLEPSNGGSETDLRRYHERFAEFQRHADHAGRMHRLPSWCGLWRTSIADEMREDVVAC
jgi:hypothetical protein